MTLSVRHGLDPAVAERLGALAVGVEGDDLGLRLLPQPALGRRACRGAHLLAVEAVLAGDLGVVGRHHDVLAGDVVRAGEVDLQLALVVDRVGRHDEVDLTVGDDVLPDARHGLGELDLILGLAERLGDDLGDLDVEALDLARGRVLEPEQRLVELHADGDAVGLAEAGQLAAGFGRVARRRVTRRRGGGPALGGGGARRRGCCRGRGGAGGGGGRGGAAVVVVIAAGGDAEQERAGDGGGAHRAEEVSSLHVLAFPHGATPLWPEISGGGPWRGSRGPARTSVSPKKASGVPVSTIRPSSMKTTRLAARPGEAHLVRDDEHGHAVLGQTRS